MLAGGLDCRVNCLFGPAMPETTLLNRWHGLLLSYLVPGRFGLYGTLPSHGVVTAAGPSAHADPGPARRARVRVCGRAGPGALVLSRHSIPSYTRRRWTARVSG
ncbi:hypothetical protein ACWDG9_16755 [Streptomyces sp. NPDC001073]